MQPQEQNPEQQATPPQSPAADWQQPAAPIASDASIPAAPLQQAAPAQPLVSPDIAAPAIEAQPLTMAQPAPVSSPSEAELAAVQAGTPDEDVDTLQEQPYSGDEELIRWQATEHIHREKDARWYALFAVIVVVLVVIAIFLVRSWTFALLIPVMAAALVIYARRPPAIIDYTLSRKGLHVNDKLYEYELFKEFGLVHDDDENAVILVPRKRFQPGITVYFPDEAGESVVDMFAARLPMHEVRLDPIDRLIRSLHI
jgi:hypothetical protein